MTKFIGVGVWMLAAVSAWAQDSGRREILGGMDLAAPGPGEPSGEPLPTRLALSDLDPESQDPQKTRVVTVTDQDRPLDDQPVGPYHKPFWTSERASPATRIYIQVDPGEVEFEQWVDIRDRQWEGHGQPRTTAVRMSEEFEFGLGGRFQLDLYMNTIMMRDGANSTLAIRNWSGEIRYALADWGVIPANPTLYLEYILWNNEPAAGGDGATSSIEGKLLLGDDIGEYWHWGSNMFLEHTTNGSVLETGVTLSVFRTIIDQVLSGGFAAQYVYESDANPGGVHVRFRELFVGPTLQLRFAPRDVEEEVNGVKVKKSRPRAHLDLEPLIGVSHEADAARIQIVFGWDF
ncbi:MAG TPA: hypothetical protein VEN81_15260 [Planctomycetota bacterium]|nr:hypothetical protein [Planctomycetota bacterium]